MGKIYCPNCGFKNEFTSRRPSFCSSCGTPIGKSPPAGPNANLDTQSFSDESSSDSTHVPRIKNLQYEVEYEKNKYKGSDLIDS